MNIFIYLFINTYNITITEDFSKRNASIHQCIFSFPHFTRSYVHEPRFTACEFYWGKRWKRGYPQQ